jgi:CPA2 family monovalent cation:H+ antiporter-2
MANPESEFLLGLLIFEDIAAPVAVAVLVGLTAGSALTAMTFGVIIATMAADTIRILSGVFILSSAMIGILLFELAPKITNALFPKKAKPRKYKVPGS